MEDQKKKDEERISAKFLDQVGVRYSQVMKE